MKSNILTIFILFVSAITYGQKEGINAQEKNRSTELIRAVLNEDEKLVYELIQRKADLEKQDKYGKTALMWALSTGNSAIINALIKAGASLNKADNEGFTPLMEATMHDLHDIVQYIIQHDPSTIYAKDRYNRTALDIALKMGRKKIIDLLTPLQKRPTLLRSFALGKYDEHQPRAAEKKIVAAFLEQPAIPAAAAPLKTQEKEKKDISARTELDNLNREKLIADARAQIRAFSHKYSVDPITEAIYEKETNQLVSLLQKASRQDINKQDQFGKTPLMWALEQKNIPAVHALINAGANINIADNDKTTPLMEAVRIGKVPLVELLLTQSTRSIDAQDKHGQTALMIAIQLGLYDIVEALLRFGARQDIKNSITGETAHALVIKRLNALDKRIAQAQAVQAKLSEEFGKKIPEKLSESQLQTIREKIESDKEMFEAIEALLDPKLTAVKKVLRAVEQSRFGVRPDLKTALEEIKNPRIRLLAAKKTMPLIYSRDYQIPDAFRAWTSELLKVDPEIINAQDQLGFTPLMWAIYRKNEDAIIYLLERKADTNIRNNLGATALHLAARLHYIPGIQRLLQAGANPNVQDSNGNTPLCIEAKNRISLDGLQLLLQAGADPNIKCFGGETALTIAVMHGYGTNLHAIERLVEAGADPRIKNSEDQTAGDMAQQRNFKQISKVLTKAALEHGLKKKLEIKKDAERIQKLRRAAKAQK